MNPARGGPCEDAPELAVFAALGWEIRPVLAALDRVEAKPVGPFRGWLGGAAGRSVRVVKTGIGSVRARAAACEVLRRETGPTLPRCILSTGCAGGLRAGFGAGDLMLASRVVRPDGTRVEPLDSEPALRLSAWARDKGIVLNEGGLYSVDGPLRTPADKEKAGAAHQAIAVDMEAAALAEIASGRRTGFVSVRSVLDPLHTALPDLGGAQCAGAALLRSFTRPREILSVGRLGSLRRAAEAGLALFFERFFREGGVVEVLRASSGSPREFVERPGPER